MNRIAILAVFVTGCAAHQLTPEAQQVRVITPGVATTLNCKYLGMKIARGVAIEGGMSAAQVKIRNRVADAGGNAMVVTDQHLDYAGQYAHGNITVDAYKCPQ